VRIVGVIGALFLLSAACSCQRPSQPAVQGVQSLRVNVLAEHPHDPGAFTQGLVWYGGKLFESTGQFGQSGVRRVELKTGGVELGTSISADLFGEGLAEFDHQLIQLTWKNGKALYWDLATLRPIKEVSYEGEGWGVCFDGTRLVMSDGSDRLTFRDPKTFAETGHVDVRKDGVAVRNLNELECVDGQVYANIWQYDYIARIDPETGSVTGWIDAANLLSPADRRGTDVLNGIAYVPTTKRFVLTGKNWPKLFEVQFVPAQ
jgi:glutaminyl-peptide cyclotransferase